MRTKQRTGLQSHGPVRVEGMEVPHTMVCVLKLEIPFLTQIWESWVLVVVVAEH